jgi:hypothetical protein
MFADEGMSDAGVESVPAAEVQDTPSESGVEPTVAAEPEKSNNFEKAFAKRLAEKESAWKAERETLEAKYKDYDAYKSVAEYYREVEQAPDVLSLKERIELQRLEQEAYNRNLPVEELKRMQELEAKAAQADEYERFLKEFEQQQQQVAEQQKQLQEFRSTLEPFAQKNGVDPDALHNFMYENQIGSMEAALKAFKFDEMQQQLESAKKDGIKEFLTAKSKIPTVPDTKATATKVAPAPKNFAEARARAMQRLTNTE